MKSCISKILAVVTAVVVTVVTFSVNVKAEVWTSTIYSTSAATAGTYKREAVHTLKSTLATVYGGDVGIWFYSGHGGLQASFYPSTNRVNYINCWEKDYNGNDELVRMYKGYYEVVNGIYKQTTISTEFTSNRLIESESTVELYLSFMVATDSRDTSKSVPTDIIRYRFWAY